MSTTTNRHMRTVTTLELWPLDRLEPYERNSRAHTPEQVQGIAASIAAYGFNAPIVVDTVRSRIAAGHGRLMAARLLGMESVPVVLVDHMTEQEFRAYVIADNAHTDASDWDRDALAAEVRALDADGVDLAPIGLSDDELAELLAVPDDDDADTGAGDEPPEVQEVAVSRPGDVWVLGDHRAMCGDSTRAEDVARLVGGEIAALLHADPPYGMGKEADGVENDNLRGARLDAFQLAWWCAWRPYLRQNASAYIWGNAPELWRLWYSAGLSQTETMELRNEIVWAKGSARGQRWDGAQMYPPETERCLFFQLGEQFLGSVNADEFPESWGPVLDYFQQQADAGAITPADVRRVCGVGMFSHWFTKSQFTLMPAGHYAAMGAAYPGLFARPWAEIKREWDRVKRGPQSKISERRSYFDNVHDAMTDVWQFSPVVGEDRHGHATPKPVPMMERVMLSSLPDGGLCVEPFGGSGSTLIGAARTGRRCYTMELAPQYVDVIVRRWQAETGRAAFHAETGQSFEDLAAERA